MNQAVKTGLIAGVAVVALMAGEVYSPSPTFTAIFQFAYRIVFIASIYVGIKRTRDIELQDEFPFKLGLKAGITTGLVAAIFMSAFMVVEMMNINLHEFIGELKRNGADNTVIMQQLRMINLGNAMKVSVFLATLNIVLAFFVSIAVTLLLRKRGGLINQQ